MDAHARTYSLFCHQEREESVMEDLRSLGYAPMAPQVRKVFAKELERPSILRRLFPGYVFFEAGQTPNWKTIRSLPNVFRVLSYGDEESPLRGDDLKFVQWLKRHGGILESSLAVREGTKLKFVSGPLKELNDRIVAVNAKRRVVAVALSNDSAIGQKIWCWFDFK